MSLQLGGVWVETKQLTETKLYNKLKNGYDGKDAIIATKITTILEELCKKATDMMKRNVSLHKQFTLHDEVHLVRVTELMAMILGEDGINALNPMEIMLLILSAYYHDIGMVPNDNEIENLEKNSEYKVFCENWKLNHPTYKEAQQIIKKCKREEVISRCADIITIFNSAIITDYIRINHGKLAKQIIEQQANSDNLWKIEEVDFSYLVAKISESHTLPMDIISDLSQFPVDERYLEYSINIQYLCIVLRLADVLDFDKERTPDELYKAISFTNSVSVQEWEKHRSITGWEISNECIRFTAQCTHPSYQRTIYRFMDYIDSELVKCHEVVRDFPERVKRYKLNIPVKVERDRIVAKNNSYIYHDLEISVSRDEIVKLLMMDELYGSRSLCVRELLQNALDALRYRKKIFKSAGFEWNDGKVVFRQYVDEYGRINLICEDNGIGMDENIVNSYLTKAGRSYYKSPEFQQIRLELLHKGIDFNPCSQFGIGFMSCFMLGDEIHIHTRRDYGHGKMQGIPLVIEMNGISGILLIKKGNDSQPVGTTIRIIGKEKPRYFDEWVDNAWLIETLDAFALECEFPIEAICDIDEIRESCEILPNTLFNKTMLEIPKLEKHIITYEYDLCETNRDMRGKMRVSFLVDSNGRITLKNDLAEIVKDKKYDRFVCECSDEVIDLDSDHQSAVCCDGIFVCGSPGRKRNEKRMNRIGMRADLFHLGNVSYVADIRGDLKPLLTPARTPKEHFHNMHPTWKKVGKNLEDAIGRLWEKVFNDITDEAGIITAMILAVIYGFRLEYLPEDVIFNKLYVPILLNSKMQWKKLSDIEKFEIKGEKLFWSESYEVDVDESIQYYTVAGRGRELKASLLAAIKNISYLGIEHNRTYLYVKRSHEIQNVQKRMIYSDSFIGVGFMNYASNVGDYISILTGYKTVNRNHPLFKYFWEDAYSEEKSSLSNFVKSFIFFVTDKDNIKDLKEGKIDKWQKKIGCLYLDVDWENYGDIPSDGYKIWSSEYGEIEITQKMLIEWSEYKISGTYELYL